MEDRLLKLLDTEQLSSSKFADVIGVQRSSISHILSGRNKPSFDFLQKILRAFPMLNADWLILGEGNMYEGEPGPLSGSLFDQPLTSTDQNKQGITDSELSSAAATASDSKTEFDPISDSVTESGHEADTLVQDVIQGVSRAGTSPSPERGAGRGGKSVSRIILLYDDSTFDAYDPG